MASTTTPDAPVKQRASAAGVTVTIGTASVVVDFVPAAVSNKDKASQFHSLCPKCEDLVRLRQVLACPACDHAVTRGEVTRHGKEVDKKLVEVTEAEIAAVRGSDDDGDETGPKSMTLSVVRTASLMESTLNGDAVYRLRPNAKTTVPQGYEVLRRLTIQALRTGRMIVGDISVGGGSPRLFWLSVRHGQIVAQSLLRPDDVAPFDEVADVELSEKTSSMVGMLIEHLTVDFDPAEFRNRTRERAEALIAAKAIDPGATITTLVPRTVAAAGDDLEALMASMLAS